MNFISIPVISIDNDYEQVKREREVSPSMTADYVITTLEITPRATILKIQDSWLPTEESFYQAQDGIFTACSVTFDGLGTYDIPMNKTEFKELFSEEKKKISGEFISNVEVVHLQGKEQITEFLKKIQNESEENTNEDLE
jgi:hypothetical protein